MASAIESDALARFLAAHEPIVTGASFAEGDLFGDWRVTAFLGRGGSGEVFRVVHVVRGTAAALKVCVKSAERDESRDAAVCARFRREAQLLAENTHPAFPRFFAVGERAGRPWCAMELLEHRPLPASEREIARFLLAVASGVRHLHARSLVHRDIKPANILWRGASPVLIDLGLVKDTSAVRGHAGASLSIVDGKAVGVGTPRYAAPEQLAGEDVTPATDVYALGMLANDCFGGKPPRRWRRIIQHATAAVPAQRYATAAAFARAVGWVRVCRWMERALALAVAVVAVLALWMPFRVDDTPLPRALPTIRRVAAAPSRAESPAPTVENVNVDWERLCRTVTTNVVTTHSDLRMSDAVRRLSTEERMMLPANVPRFEVMTWAETNTVNAAVVELDGRTVVVDAPIKLDAGREFWIAGPGVLDAQFSAASTATVRLANCIFLNRTKTKPADAGIDYVLDGSAYLNFTELPDTEAMRLEVGARIRSNGQSAGRRWWRIRGPDNLEELVDDDNQSSLYSATMESF